MSHETGPAAEPADGPGEVDPTPDDLPWLAVIPSAALVVVAMVWLGPPLARLAYPPPSWKPILSLVGYGFIRPEGVEQTRYVIALTAPFVVIAMWLACRKWYPGDRRSDRLTTGCVLVVQAATTALVVACWIAQQRSYLWFRYSTLLVATGLALAFLVVARRGWIVPGPAAPKHPLVRRGAGTVIAIVLTGYSLLPAVFSTTTAVRAGAAEVYQIDFVRDELASVLNGRTPMVDFAAQYSKLLPFVVSPALAVTSPSVGVTTSILGLLGLLGFLAAYGMFVVVTEDHLVALGLYAPFLAISLFTVVYLGDERLNVATVFNVVPLRVVGPFVLGWLLARRLRKGGDRSVAPLFAVAGLVAINNIEFGGPALVALALALWCGRDRRSPRSSSAATLGVQAILGAGAAVVAVCLLTLVRSGSLPNVEYITHVTRVFAVEGFFMEPIRPTLGLHIIIYLTFVAAVVVGVIDALRSDDSSPRACVMRGMLIYSGVLGLGAGTYWVGRSVPSALFGMFPTWGLSVAILCFGILRGAAVHRRLSVRWVLPAAGVLVAFGLMATVVVQIPTPASQVRRFTPDGPDKLVVSRYAESERFVAEHTQRGDRVAILTLGGHILARDAGVVNVSPFADPRSIAFYEQMDLLLGNMRRDKVTTVFVGPDAWPETTEYLVQKGYVAVGGDPASGMTELRSSRP